MLYLSNKNTRKRCRTYSKLITKELERCHWFCSVVFIVSFEHFFTPFSSASIPTLNKQLFAGMSDSFENPSGDYSGDYYTFVEDSFENKIQKIDCL